MQVRGEMALRRSSGDTGNQTIIAHILPAQRAPSVRWYVEDTTENETETADKPVSGTFTDLFRGASHRARSLPDLADVIWSKSGESGHTKNTGDRATCPVVLVTDVNMATSSPLSPSYMKPNSSSISNNKVKRATSFAERPAVITAVSSSYFVLFCLKYCFS